MDEPSLRQATPRDSGPALRDIGGYLLLLVVAGLLFFARLRSPLLEPEDAFYAEVPRQMLAGGQWLVPMHEGRPFYQKPPLLYWLIMGSYAVFGVHDWAARLVPCLSGLGIVLVTFWWGKRLLGFRAGLAGALILCLSARFVHQTRMITMDGLLCFCIIAALALGQQALQAGPLSRWRWLLSALAGGLGLLTKGPVALVLVLVPLMAFQILDRRARIGIWSWLAYLGTAVGVALPWCLTLAWRDPDFFREFLWNHHVVMRFVQPLHDQPVWFYLPALLLGMLPWALLVPGLFKLLVQRFGPGKQKLPAELIFLLLCCSWCLLFFSAAPCKRIGYILPAMPTLALALGHVLDKGLPGEATWSFLVRGRRSSLSCWAMHGVLALGIVVPIVAGISGLVGPMQCVTLSALAAAGMLWLIFRSPCAVRQKLGVAGSWAGCALATFVLLLLCIHVLLPGYYRRFSLRNQVRSFLDSATSSDIPVVCHPHHCDSVSFYLGRGDIRSYNRDERQQMIADLGSRPETIVFVKTGSVLNDMLDLLPDSLEFVRKGRASWMTAGLVRRRAIIATRP